MAGLFVLGKGNEKESEKMFMIFMDTDIQFIEF